MALPVTTPLPSPCPPRRLAPSLRWATLAPLALMLACGRPEGAETPKLSVACPPPTPGASPLTWTHLPAVSKDGAKVALAIAREDGARGAPNLSVQIRDVATDTIEVEHIVLAAASEWSCSDPSDTLEANLKAAQKTLDAHTWFPLPALGTTNAYAASAANPADFAVSYREPDLFALSLTQTRLSRTTHPTWRMDTLTSLQDPDLPCGQPSALQAAWGDAAHGVAVVRIAYTGNDACPEPDSHLHVIPVPKRDADQPSPCTFVEGTCASSCTEGYAAAAAPLTCTDPALACCLPAHEAAIFPANTAQDGS